MRFLAFILLLISSVSFASPSPIRVGVLHSLTGTMAFSEHSLKDAVLMLIDEQNQQGGLLGRPLEAVVLDPQSNDLLYAEKARQLIERENVAVIFGGWTSASRKAVLPVVEELDALLFYPVQYEGQEQSSNIFYFGATPRQQAIPAVDYLQQYRGIKRWILVGSDYVYPRTTNRIIKKFLSTTGVSHSNIMLAYQPLGHRDWQGTVADIKRFTNNEPASAIISTVNGDSNQQFYQELYSQGVRADHLPVLAFSIGEPELAKIDPQLVAGHLASWNYFMSLDTPTNLAFIKRFQAFTENSKQLASDPIEAHYVGFNMWLNAVKKAKSVDVDKVREAMVGIKATNLSGKQVQMRPNHHTSKPVYIGRAKNNGQYSIIWQSENLIKAQPFFDNLATPNAQE